MVKNLPTVERSTRIRFGKNCTEDQAENTIVFNASNVQIDASNSGSVYITPIRIQDNYEDPNFKMMIYNSSTKELVNSNVIAETVLKMTLEDVIINGNVTSNTVSFNNTSTSITTLSNVGIANGAPIHTLDVGSKFYVDEVGSNVLTVLGDTYLQDNLIVGGNLDVRGAVTAIDTVNTTIKDAIIEIGKGNVSSDMGIIMDRSGTNVALGYREGVDEFVIAYTDSSATSSTVVPSSELIDVRVHGRLHVNSNLTVDTDTFHVDAVRDRVGINTLNPQTDFDVVGEVSISSNLTVDGGTLHVDTIVDRVGINTLTPSTDFHVEGETYISGNVTVNTNTFHVDTVNDRVGINTLNPVTDFHVEGNTYVTGNVDVQSELNVTGNAYVSSNVVVTGNVDVQSNLNVSVNAVVNGNLDVQTDLNVSGNAYMSSNTVVTGNVDVQSELNVTGNVFVDSNVMVVGNVHAATYYGDGGLLSNVTLQVVSDYGNTTSNTIQFTNPTTAFTTDLTSNVSVKVDQLHNVNIDTPLDEQILVYDGTDWVNEFPMHTYIKIRNDTAATIGAGDGVYVRGTHNANIINVGLAQSNTPSTMPCIGLSNQILTAGQEGTAVAYGKALSVVTGDFVAGETVYVSNTVPGGLSNVKPYNNDLIQNVGVVTKIHASNGSVFVTGIGRANDVPNAQLAYANSDINWVYVNNENNDFKKIEPSNLLTKLQTLEQVVNTGNSVSNIINVTGLTTTANVEVGSNISVIGLADPNNKYFPMVNHDGFFQQSPVFVTDTGKYVISASEAEFLGNITLSGSTTILNSESVTISDRIFGVGANNSATGLDSGFMIEHQDGVDDYANVALIHHPSDHRFAIGYTQNTFTDNQILYYQYPNKNLLLDIQGNLLVQNALTVTQTSTFGGAVTFTNTLTLGSNLFVEDTGSNVIHVTGNVYATRFVGDGSFLENIASNLEQISTNGNVSTSTIQFTNADTALVTTGKVGISTSNPDANLHVTGNAYVSSNVEVAGNVIVDGGLIVNRSGLTKKTYGYSGGVIADGTTPEINVVFDSQLFSAKITAHLVENTSNISVLNLDVMGGTGRNIGKGFLSIVGDQNSKHWDSVINTTDTTVTLIPSVGPVGGGSYGISVEYTSPLGTGGVTSIDKDHTNQIMFSY